MTSPRMVLLLERLFCLPTFVTLVFPTLVNKDMIKKNAVCGQASFAIIEGIALEVTCCVGVGRNEVSPAATFSATRWSTGQGLPSYGSGRYGSGAFRAQDSALHGRCSVGRRHAYCWSVSKHVGSAVESRALKTTNHQQGKQPLGTVQTGLENVISNRNLITPTTSQHISNGNRSNGSNSNSQ